MSKNVPYRQSYPAETKYPWLTLLLDSFAICDGGTKIDLQEEQRKRGQSVACHKGCSACCLNPAVPVSQPELSGISWYTTEVMDPQSFDRIIPRLLNHRQTTECPFLLDGVCSIYPVRPIACRIFYVFSTPCAPLEDIAHTRLKDMFVHSRDKARRVAMRFLDSDFYSLKTKREKEKAFDDGVMLNTSQQMHDLNWAKFAIVAEHLRNSLSQP